MNDFGFMALVLATASALGALLAAARVARAGGSPRLALTLLWISSAALLGAAAVLFVQLSASDLTNAYVVQHTASSMPLAFRLASFWAGQEGSYLLWSAFVALTAVAVCVHGRSADVAIRTRTIAAAAFVVLSMCTILILGANPFKLTDALTQPAATTQQLRHWAMLIHPPLIFAGYALCAAPFIIAAGGLLARRHVSEWMSQARVWAMAAWIVLGAGITIGAWWAYTQLGWGGYWAWDPVENASLIPWLTLMALVHALAVNRRRGTLAFWSTVLSLGTFILCGFGTFVTRGGMVQSIHSFGQSTIGWYLAVWIVALVVVAAGLMLRSRRALRAPSDGCSAEAVSVAGLGIFLLLLSAAAVLTGTVTPMVVSLFSSTPVWVGKGFYETVVGPLAMAGAFLMAVAPMMASTAQRAGASWQQPLPAIGAGLLVTIVCRVMGLESLQALMCIWMSSVAMGFTVGAYIAAVRGRVQLGGTPLVRSFVVAFTQQRRAHGTRLSHLGVAVLLMGVCTSTVLTRSYDLTLKVGEQAQAGGWTVSLRSIAAESAPDDSDDVVIRGEVSCAQADGTAWIMSPASRRLLATDQTIAEVAIRSTWSGDCFVALGEWNDMTGSVGIHVASLPGVMWIWIGAVLTGAGGLLCTLGALPRAVTLGERSTNKAGESVQETLAMPSAGAQS